MRLRDLRFIADENIHPAVIKYLNAQGMVCRALADLGLGGADDGRILQHALTEQMAVLTHDSDFGKLAVAELKPLFGIVFLRPGHIHAEFTIATLRTLVAMDLDVEPGFLVVADRRANQLRVRVRSM